MARVKMFMVITAAYLIFWGPLFLVTLFTYNDYRTEDPSTSHEVRKFKTRGPNTCNPRGISRVLVFPKVTLHVAFVHAFVNPTLFLVLHKGLRKVESGQFFVQILPESRISLVTLCDFRPPSTCSAATFAAATTRTPEIL